MRQNLLIFSCGAPSSGVAQVDSKSLNPAVHLANRLHHADCALRCPPQRTVRVRSLRCALALIHLLVPSGLAVPETIAPAEEDRRATERSVGHCGSAQGSRGMSKWAEGPPYISRYCRISSLDSCRAYHGFVRQTNGSKSSAIISVLVSTIPPSHRNHRTD